MQWGDSDLVAPFGFHTKYRYDFFLFLDNAEGNTDKFQVATSPDHDSDEPNEDDIKEREEEVQKLKALGLDEHTELSYSVLNPSSIMSLCRCLTLDEACLFGLQLGLPLSIKEIILEAQHPARELAFRLLEIWSGSRHCTRRVRKIQEALQRVNREDLANAVGMAFDNDLPFIDSAFAPKAKFLNEI
ncbi:uncharacterized protein LOC144621400 [Crassostrea virginica]